MKNIVAVIFLFALAACSASNPKGDQPSQRMDGKSRAVVLNGVQQNESPGKSFFVLPKEDKEGWTVKERQCVLELTRALELSGLKQVRELRKAQLLIGVLFPKTGKASDLTLTALMGGFRHSVALEARDQKRKLVWKLDGYIEDESEDIAKVFPFLAAAMVGHFGKDASGERVTIDEYDPLVEKIRDGAGGAKN